ncbi:DUF3800 domain-containing protein [Breznakia pachnodae]|uniref:Uncharacterized protein n=1 Tax=Breznakia pachnodae TaxID=265178 RepID=A0ABU0DZ27_9FIRM|nr:DUF3800 domain-containing protein [Breznakia pachnodae]MDQ0359764.1 hypothetical protein [Breznakia pachnodae]
MWREKPTVITSCPINITHIAFMDENGNVNMKNVINHIENNVELDLGSSHFCLTSVLINRENLTKIGKEIKFIKTKHWGNKATYLYGNEEKQVCFHSRDIRMQKGPFNQTKINSQKFMNDLNQLMKKLPISITSCCIDKVFLYKIGGNLVKSPYTIAVTKILETLVTVQLKTSDKALIILESRGKKEDCKLLNEVVDLIEFGTSSVSINQFNKIVGVYFNPKRVSKDIHKASATFWGLEIADLCSYPIYKKYRGGQSDTSFLLIERKIHGYPDYLNKGMIVIGKD